MTEKTASQRLQALAADDTKRSKTARLRELLDDVERALASGVTRNSVHAELNAAGLQMSFASFETTLKRLRAERRKTITNTALKHSRPIAPNSQTTSSEPQSPAHIIKNSGQTAVNQHNQTTGSHDPRDLDRIMRSTPDLAALAKFAKGMKK